MEVAVGPLALDPPRGRNDFFSSAGLTILLVVIAINARVVAGISFD